MFNEQYNNDAFNFKGKKKLPKNQRKKNLIQISFKDLLELIKTSGDELYHWSKAIVFSNSFFNVSIFE